LHVTALTESVPTSPPAHRVGRIANDAERDAETGVGRM
jgi:hypothetical protein